MVTKTLYFISLTQHIFDNTLNLPPLKKCRSGRPPRRPPITTPLALSEVSFTWPNTLCHFVNKISSQFRNWKPKWSDILIVWVEIVIIYYIRNRLRGNFACACITLCLKKVQLKLGGHYDLGFEKPTNWKISKKALQWHLLLTPIYVNIVQLGTT